MDHPWQVIQLKHTYFSFFQPGGRHGFGPPVGHNGDPTVGPSHRKWRRFSLSPHTRRPRSRSPSGPRCPPLAPDFRAASLLPSYRGFTRSFTEILNTEEKCPPQYRKTKTNFESITWPAAVHRDWRSAREIVPVKRLKSCALLARGVPPFKLFIIVVVDASVPEKTLISDRFGRLRCQIHILFCEQSDGTIYTYRKRI